MILTNNGELASCLESPHNKFVRVNFFINFNRNIELEYLAQ